MATRRLIVFVPGTACSPGQWNPLLRKFDGEPGFEQTVWKGWDHGVGWVCLSSLADKAVELRAFIDAQWKNPPPEFEGGFEELVLVGHSLGAILIRQCYLVGAGRYRDEPESAWAGAVARMVFLAGLNRGLDQEKWQVRLYDLATRFAGSLYNLPRAVFGFRRQRLLAQDVISGSEALTDLRLTWIDHMRSLPQDKRPAIVQILGDQDSIVSRRDSIDLEQFPNAAHLPVPGINHRQLPRIDEGPEPSMRVRFIRDAVLGRALPDKAPSPVSKGREAVVFVLHGIRAANRGWVQEMESAIKHAMPTAEVITPSYGYLSALEFAIPFLHRRPIREFQQRYSDAVMENPGAHFHFIGHSNGTYILGHSLSAVPSIRFDRVALAGSVLPRAFRWRKMMSGQHPQLRMLRNDCANGDIPVGFLCSGLTGLFRSDVGTGGFEGFYDDDASIAQYFFHGGGHSAALRGENLASIAQFVANGSDCAPAGMVKGRPGMEFLSRLAPWIFRVMILGLAALLTMSVITQSAGLFVGVLSVLSVLAFFLKVL